MKTREPKKTAPSQVRLGYEVKLVEMEFGQEMRISMEIFHEQGKFSSAMSTFRARAVLLEGTEPNAAIKVLVEKVKEVVGDTLKERIDETLEAIENQSYR